MPEVIVWGFVRWSTICATDHSGRLNSLYEILDDRGIDAYYTNDLLNMRYLTEFKGTAGGLLVYSTDESGSVLLLDGRYRLYAERLSSREVSTARVEDSRIELLDELAEEFEISSIHFERPNLTYETFLSIRDDLSYPAEKEYGDDWILKERRKKSESEVESITEAIDQTLDVFELIESWLEPGLSEKALSRAIRRELESRSDGLAFDPLVLSGPNTANPHCPASERPLEQDDWLLVDQGLKVDGYCSDLTRMFFFGDPDSQIRELYDLSKRSATRAYEAIEPGRSIAEVTEFAHDLVKDAGYEDNLRHGLGHGVGLNVHEPPSLSPKSDGILEPGMVVTLEPGIYIDGFGGGRIEHMIYLEEDGPRLLDTVNEHLEEAI